MIEFRIVELCQKIIMESRNLLNSNVDIDWRFEQGRLSATTQIRKLIFETSCAICDYEPKCECAWDLYNIDTVAKIDCLMSK